MGNKNALHTARISWVMQGQPILGDAPDKVRGGIALSVSNIS
jgi:hypothetical protein